MSFLIGLAASNGYAESFRDFLNVSDIQCHQFRPAERAGKAEQQQRTVAQVGQTAIGTRRKRDDVVCRRRRNPPRCDPTG